MATLKSEFTSEIQFMCHLHLRYLLGVLHGIFTWKLPW